MESFNFGAFDPTIGARIAAIPQEAQKQQTANMLQAMQVQGAMNQNELARYSLASAQRSDASQNAVNAALKGSIVDGKINYNLLTSNLAGGAGASKIPDFLKARSEEEKRTQEIEKTKGDIAKQAREAVDSELTSFTKNAFKVTDVPSLTNHLKAFYENPLLGKIASKFKPFDQALKDDIKQISTPEGLRQWQAENANLTGKELTDLLLKVTTTTANLGDVSRETQRGGMGQTIGVPVDTPMGVSPNTTAQINAARKIHLENLAQQGWTFDSERGLAVNARRGISQPISTLMTPVSGGAAPAVGGAPVPSIAPGGGVPGQRQAPAGQPAAGVLAPKQEKAPAEFTKMDNQLSNLVGNLNRFKQEIAKGKTTSAQWAPTGADTAAMNAKYISLLMGMKDMYTLGALTGPDLGLIEAQISNPATWGGFTKSREAFNAQIDNVEQQLKDASLNLENSYGHKPKATSAAFLRNPATSKDSPSAPPIQSFRRP
jgi:hypothetical protein